MTPQQEAAIKTLEFLGYTYHGGEQWKPPLGKKPEWLEQPCKYPKCSYPCPDLPDCKDAEQQPASYDQGWKDGYKHGAWASEQQPAAWVGLTQQDIDIAFDDTQEGGGFDDFARAIEAKLKEKNT